MAEIRNEYTSKVYWLQNQEKCNSDNQRTATSFLENNVK